MILDRPLVSNFWLVATNKAEDLDGLLVLAGPGVKARDAGTAVRARANGEIFISDCDSKMFLRIRLIVYLATNF